MHGAQLTNVFPLEVALENRAGCTAECGGICAAFDAAFGCAACTGV
jgi:hypothetical protein